MSQPIRIRESSGKVVGRRAQSPPKRDTAAELREVLQGQGIGLNAGAARRAAAGRDGVMVREAVKNIAGLSAKAFAWVPDVNDPATWQLQLCRLEPEDGAWLPDAELVQLAVSQVLVPASAGTPLAIPDADLPKVLAALKAAWIAAGLIVEEMPEQLKNLELVNAFRAGGMNIREAMAAARVRRP